MCILCDAANLRLLIAPLHTLEQTDFVEAIRVAREAAMQVVLDAADNFTDVDATPALTATVGLESYLDYVVERAERDGVLKVVEMREWTAAIRDRSALEDPRVQAFLSSAAEGLASYVLQIEEHRAVLQRFLEVPQTSVGFAGIGAAGEVTFAVGEDRYVVLSEEEALRVVMERLVGGLSEEDPVRLLPYTSLPAGSIDYLADAQKRPQEEANEILASLIDLHAMAEDAVRKNGFARYVADGLAEEYTEQRFGDRVVIRLRSSLEEE